ncbi:MAG: 1-(5-phosphoribosyl)-5-((5-phosphoribosylamino)methylideneamino)imidazole-4-carboxamide isomerase, partial [Anaerolineae bacterium]|nr:1-(5-phosphoribosyl)-5-((5-phosphoribosylamino)methylideneamino)imidazole-4-carboxamide isomerase [Anaerolineae bacterium]
MIVLPAIDLRQGHVVRLRQGCGDAQTVYDDDPIAVARHWAGQGATWLHVVDLDGALSAGMPSEKIPPHVRRLQALCTAVSGVSVQFGGGLRSLPAIARALEAGAARVVLGTVAVQQPALL